MSAYVRGQARATEYKLRLNKLDPTPIVRPDLPFKKHYLRLALFADLMAGEHS